MSIEHHCHHCGANWSAGEFSADCDECGGGAMDIACLRCGGKCGQRWQRAVMDTHDSGLAHWMGKCDSVMLKSDSQGSGDTVDAGCRGDGAFPASLPP